MGDQESKDLEMKVDMASKLLLKGHRVKVLTSPSLHTDSALA